MSQVNIYVITVSTWRKVSRGNDTGTWNELAGKVSVFVVFDKEEADSFCAHENENCSRDLLWSWERVPVRGALELGDALAAMAEGYIKESVRCLEE